MLKHTEYEPVIGLECHIQLLTNTKMYSSDRVEYGAPPNSRLSPITLGHPGTLPRINKKAVEMAIILGKSLGCTITKRNEFARKNYFYPDLPKGYQITQDKTPICTGGHVTFRLNGQEKKVNLIRIHMEEDSGKSIHDLDPFNTLVDLNRAGTPLLEMVSAPDLRSGEEAYAYLYEIRKIVRYLGICDGNMEEGSLRCDANISVRRKGKSGFGKKVEVKNLNSFRHVQKAIDFEIQRQIELLEKGAIIVSETRAFDPAKGITISMRTKETAQDYRYFPEPDLSPIILTDDFIQKTFEQAPELPSVVFKRLTQEFNLPEYDATQLTENKEFALFFLQTSQHCKHYKSISNWLLVPVKNYLNENGIGLHELSLTPLQLAEIIELVESGKVSHTQAVQKLFPAVIQTQKKPAMLIHELDIVLQTNASELESVIQDILNRYPEKVAEYKKGKKGLLGLFVGEAMKATKGKSDPKAINQLLLEKLNQS
ncbi:MAG: Asp-tRNA(Asn)/Glu-tRNA(Gln) amidotransferase subunit GatB [Bacteroidia bacterium]|nr:Asp-tRNA(Asn)/Glu-tRNA(Gln) amidotransferase subunit GatB [Bacteroidia bacterium]